MFALARLFKDGGYLIIRKSHWGPFPHFLWSPKAPREVKQFVPHAPEPRLLPKLWFHGYIKEGDE